MTTLRAQITGSTAAEIAESLRNLIDAGTLEPGASLPSVRALAQDLQVNRNTVVAAYGIVAQAGLVVGAGRAGTKVVESTQLPQEGSSGAEAHLIDLAHGNPDPQYLPSPAEALTQIAQDHPVLYGHSVIDPALEEWAKAEFSKDLTTEFELTVTAGSADAVDRLLAGALIPGDAVGFEQPCFLTSITTAQAAGYKPVPMDVDQHGIHPEALRNALEAGVRAIVVTPRAHNPTGVSITAQRARELRDLLAEYPHVLVIEDDHYWMLATTDYHSVIPDHHPRWAVVRSVSKSLGPDLRLGLVAADHSTTTRLGAKIHSGGMWVSHLLQRLTCLLATDATVQELISEAAKFYHEKNERLIEDLRAAGISASVDDGVNTWIQVGVDPDQVVAAMKSRRWLVRSGREFYLTEGTGPVAAGMIRVTGHGLGGERRRQFVEDLAQVLRQVR